MGWDHNSTFDPFVQNFHIVAPKEELSKIYYVFNHNKWFTTR